MNFLYPIVGGAVFIVAWIVIERLMRKRTAPPKTHYDHDLRDIP